MRRINELHPPEYLFAGKRTQHDMLKREGVEVDRKHVGRLMTKMDGEAIYRKANTNRRDNVFVERRWKSVTHEKIYRHGYDTVSEAAGIDPPFRFLQPPSSALDACRQNPGYGLLQPAPARRSGLTRRARTPAT